MIGIYKIINKINGKVYIGQSIDIEKRWKQHSSRAFWTSTNDYNTMLSQAYRKYGIENFTYEVLEVCDKTALDNREKYWIQYYQSNNNSFGYNMTPGGNIVYNNLLENQETIPEHVIKTIDLLKNTLLSYSEITELVSLNINSISAINLGKTWKQENLIYPIRKQENKTYTCVNCCKEIDKKATRCRECYNLSLQKNTRPSRETLKEEIRILSFLELGRKYGVSDNAIRKWCDSYDLPRKKTEIKSYSDKEWEQI